MAHWVSSSDNHVVLQEAVLDIVIVRGRDPFPGASGSRLLPRQVRFGWVEESLLTGNTPPPRPEANLRRQLCQRVWKAQGDFSKNEILDCGLLCSFTQISFTGINWFALHLIKKEFRLTSTDFSWEMVFELSSFGLFWHSCTTAITCWSLTRFPNLCKIDSLLTKAIFPFQTSDSKFR